MCGDGGLRGCVSAEGQVPAYLPAYVRHAADLSHPISSHPILAAAVQAALVLGQVQELVCRTLVQWITQASAAPCHLASGVPSCHAGCKMLELAFVSDYIAGSIFSQLCSIPCLQGSSSSNGGANGEAGAADGAPACPPGLMRFGAHLALALWSLDIAEVAEG